MAHSSKFLELRNPSNEDLNIAFAIHVAKWTDVKSEERTSPFSEVGTYQHWSGIDPRWLSIRSNITNFTFFVDKVLPYLQHYHWAKGIHGHLDISNGTARAVYVPKHDGDGSLARAMVIVLLRINGVSVIFDENYSAPQSESTD